jgi:cytochrome c oxidase subunit 2
VGGRVLLALSLAAGLAAGCGRPPAADELGWSGPGAPLEVGVLGQDGRWRFAYPGPDRRLGTQDDRWAGGELVLPAATAVTLHLDSDDGLYFFGVPELGLREAASPGLGFRIEFRTAAPASYAIVGDPMCGLAHPDLDGRLRVVEARPFLTWLGRQPVDRRGAVAGAFAGPDPGGAGP